MEFPLLNFLGFCFAIFHSPLASLSLSIYLWRFFAFFWSQFDVLFVFLPYISLFSQSYRFFNRYTQSFQLFPSFKAFVILFWIILAYSFSQHVKCHIPFTQKNSSEATVDFNFKIAFIKLFCPHAEFSSSSIFINVRKYRYIQYRKELVFMSVPMVVCVILTWSA